MRPFGVKSYRSSVEIASAVNDPVPIPVDLNSLFTTNARKLTHPEGADDSRRASSRSEILDGLLPTGAGMNKAVPWSIKGVDFDARESAKEAARRAGMTLGEWLNSVIADKAADLGVDADDVDEDSRLEAITARLAKMSRRDTPVVAAPAKRKSERHASVERPAPRRPVAAVEEEDLDDDFDDTPAPRLGARRRNEPREASFSAIRRQRRPEPAPDYEIRQVYADPEAILDEAARVFERGARRTSLETSAALAKVSRRLANIEAAIEDRDEEVPPNEVHKAIARLESRIESISKPKPVDPAEATLKQLDQKLELLASQLRPAEPDQSADISRLEGKINRLLRTVDRPRYSEPARNVAVEAAYEAAPVQPPVQQPAPFEYEPDRSLAGAPRSLTDAIAQIARRQRELDAPVAPAAAPPAPALPVARRAPPAPGWEPPVVPAAPAYQRAPQAPIAPAPVPYDPGLKNEIASLSARIDEMRRDSILREEQLRKEAAQREENLRREAEQREEQLRRDAEKRQEQLRAEQQRQDQLRAEQLRQEQQKLEQARKDAAMREEQRRAEPSQAPQLESLRRDVADMSSAVSGLAPREAVVSLEVAVRDLTRRVDASRQEGVREVVLQPIENLLKDIRNSLSDFAPRSTVDTISSELRAIGTKINALGSSEVDHATLKRVQEQTQEIRNLLAAAVAHPLPIESIERQIAALTDRVDFLATSGGSTGHADAVGQTVNEIRSSLDRSMPPSLLRTLEERIESLAHKLDDAVSQAGASDQLDELTRRIDEVHHSLAQKFERIERIERVEQPAVDVGALESLVRDLAVKIDSAVSHSSSTDQLEELTSRINDVHRELSTRAEYPAAAVSADTSLLENMIRDLAEKVEEASQASDDGGLISALQLQIARLAERLDRSDANAGSLVALERLVSDLFTQLDANRAAAITAAENAAHAAAQEVLRSSAHGQSGGLQVPESITKDLAHLRSLQDVADRRTHATLTAVHETLEKVVDRLAMLENEVVDVRVGNSIARADHIVREAREQSFARAPRKPEPDLDFDDDQATWSNKAAPAEPIHRANIADELPPQRKESPAAHIPETDIPLGRQDDILIEPGSGFAPSRRGAEAPSRREPAAIPDADAPLGSQDPRTAQSSFIAAARRAAQAATAEAAQQSGPQKGGAAAAVESALADAKARARAAAAAMSERIQDGQAKPSMLGKVRSVLAARKRVLLLGVAALIVIGGSAQVARTILFQRSAPSPVIDLAPPAEGALPGAEGTENAPAGETAPRQRQGALIDRSVRELPTASVADRTISGAVDTSPVATIPPATPVLANPTNIAAIDQSLQVGSLREQATKGVAAAQFELGLRYAEGRSVTRDLKLAAQWLEKAALQNLAPAQYRLGSLYEKGYGVDKNTQKARSWYTKSADQGNVKAMHNLAVLLADGGGDKPDYVAAAQWFHKAAEYGVRDSQYNLAILYARGLGTPQNMPQAYSWFTIAAKQGDGEAAKKRDEVAGRLNAQQLETAKSAAETFKPRSSDQAANEVEAPVGGWDAAPATVETKPQQPASKPKTNLKAKVSNL